MGIKISFSLQHDTTLARLGLIICITCLPPVKIIHAQSLPLSQPFEYGTLFNPAFAGSEVQGKISTINRLQWPDLGAPLVATGLCADIPLTGLHGGAGINLFREMEGDYFRRTRVDLMYTWDANLSHDLSVGAGLRFSWQSCSWNAGGVLLPGMIEPGTLQPLPLNETLAGERYGYPDFAAGMIGAWKNMYFGSSVHHLGRPSVNPGQPSAGRIPLSWNAHAGINITGNRRLLSQQPMLFSPGIIIMDNGYSYSLYAGSYFILKPLYAGLWFRTSNKFSYNSLISLAGFSWNNLRVAFSYDMDILGSANIPLSGAYELSASLKFDPPAKRKRIKAIKCPKI
ncbi:MAG: PorP/SprF family type IX secretion system membrane protein [Bacteroidales bacterium]